MSWTSWKTNGDHRPKGWLDQLIRLDGWDTHLIWADMTHFALLKVSINNETKTFSWVEEIKEFFLKRKKLAAGTDPSKSPISVIFEADETQFETIKESKKIKIKAGRALAAPYFTGFVGLENLDWLQGCVKRLRIGMTAAPKSRSFKVNTEEPAADSVVVDKNEVVLGIIDHGIAFANRDFSLQSAAGWTTRIENFWDQAHGYPASPSPGLIRTHSPDTFGYGWEIDSPYINGVLNFDVDDSEIYSAKNKNREGGWFNYPAAQRHRAHGTHVLSLLGGKNCANDPASAMPIIAVQLPALPYKDTSGQNLCVHVLNAVEYILEKAGGRRTVINISDGAYAGPHDGTSLLEAALDQIVKTSDGKVEIVVAAGNQFHEQIHWQDSITKDRPAEIFWRVLPDDKTDSHLEIWFDKGTTLEQLNSLVVQVESPSGVHKSMQISAGQFAWLNLNNADLPSAAAFFNLSPPNAKDRAIFHLALGATRSKFPKSQPDAPHGVWKIHIQNSLEAPVKFDAYIERDNPAMGDSGPRRQSFFVHPLYQRDNAHGCGAKLIDSDSGNTSPIKRLGTLNNIATAEHVRAVGGYVKRSRSVASYSAAGPGRAGTHQNVNYVAPSDESRTTQGILGCGVRSGTHFRMGGTSVAAPQMARAIANAMAGHNARPVTQPVTGIDERIGRGAGI
jgi:subtilisin family serine protease